jgi:hypothetical protein
MPSQGRIAPFATVLIRPTIHGPGVHRHAAPGPLAPRCDNGGPGRPGTEERGVAPVLQTGARGPAQLPRSLMESEVRG